ncbi:hypothetical protein LguiA_018503 [Lonicera macranthoides]
MAKDDDGGQGDGGGVGRDDEDGEGGEELALVMMIFGETFSWPSGYLASFVTSDGWKNDPQSKNVVSSKAAS